MSERHLVGRVGLELLRFRFLPRESDSLFRKASASFREVRFELRRHGVCPLRSMISLGEARVMAEPTAIGSTVLEKRFFGHHPPAHWPLRVAHTQKIDEEPEIVQVLKADDEFHREGFS